MIIFQMYVTINKRKVYSFKVVLDKYEQKWNFSLLCFLAHNLSAVPWVYMLIMWFTPRIILIPLPPEILTSYESVLSFVPIRIHFNIFSISLELYTVVCRTLAMVIFESLWNSFSLLSIMSTYVMLLQSEISWTFVFISSNLKLQ